MTYKYRVMLSSDNKLMYIYQIYRRKISPKYREEFKTWKMIYSNEDEINIGDITNLFTTKKRQKQHKVIGLSSYGLTEEEMILFVLRFKLKERH